MASKKTDEIIKSFLNDKEVYREMSKRESNVWGNVFSNQKRNEVVLQDQKAATELRLNRYMLRLPLMLREYNFKPSRGLSLACGNGRLERGLLSQGICQSFHGIDISTTALLEAEDLARKANLKITYEQADLNYIELSPDKYDLVVTQNCIHHVLRLENLAEQIHKTLRPGGTLWIHDYIGETQFQYNDQRLSLVNDLLAILPEYLCYNRVTGKSINQIVRREPGTLISPFEAIRSAEIVPIFLRKFDLVEKYEFNCIMHLVCPVGSRENFLRNDESKALFEMLLLLDRKLIENNILKPCGGQYFLKSSKINSGNTI